jgi:hypothetical protein
MALAAVAFGALHLNRNLIGRLDAVFTGLVDGSAVLLTGSLLTAIGAHLLGNLVAAIATWILRRQGVLGSPGTSPRRDSVADGGDDDPIADVDDGCREGPPAVRSSRGTDRRSVRRTGSRSGCSRSA